MAHHSREYDEEMRKHFENSVNEPLGATKRFPEGKLTEMDEGEIKFAVGIDQGKIVIEFGQQVTWMGMNPDQAHDLGRLLIKKAQRARRATIDR